MQRHDRLLPAAPLPLAEAASLGLGLDPGRAHAGHPDAEDLLHRLAHLRLVRALADPERVLVRREQRVALLRDHRAHDHLAGVHLATAFSVTRASAASETTRRPAPITSATPTWSACSTVTPTRLRNDLRQFSSPSVSTTSTLPSPASLASAAAAALVEGVSNLEGSTAAIEPRSACTESAARNARRRALRLILTVYERGLGPNATPPPTRFGVDSAPTRARPVPFWRQAFAPVMLTSPRVCVEAVPRRCAASSARTASCTSGPWKRSPKTASSSESVSAPPPMYLAELATVRPRS